MQEAFLHFLWKLQYFDHKSLKTTCGKTLEVLTQGVHNMHAGPDFKYGRVKIDDVIWAGHIEIHINSSDWVAHQHQKDQAYDNVILHVVWNDKAPQAVTSKGFNPPVLCLEDKVDKKVLDNYTSLLNADDAIPCSNLIKHVPVIYTKFMMEKALSERLERKAAIVSGILGKNKNDWEETVYVLFMEAMGFKANSASFKALANIIPYKILQKQEQLLQVEALLFGQAGFLANTSIADDYYQRLQKEYTYLAAKYSLKQRVLHEKDWHFMRLRPVNFPTLRIAQAAAVIFYCKKLMETFMPKSGAKQLFYGIKQAAYWQKYYHFGKKYPSQLPFIGKASQVSLLINVAGPLMVARASYLGSNDLFGKAMDMLTQLKGEKNTITRKWEGLEVKIDTAYNSQAIIEMNNNYCKAKKCLECRIGNYLIGNKRSETGLD